MLTVSNKPSWRLMMLGLALLLEICIPMLAAPGAHGTGEKAAIKPVAYRITRTDLKIKIDGKPDEEAWKKALRVPLQYETYPGENIEPPVKTECLLTYDHSNLYVAFLAFDPNPSAIRAHFTERDAIFGDDAVVVVLDTFNDENRAYGFFSNPLGIQNDVLYSDGGDREDSSWDAIWNSAGRITNSGYVVELAIPFSSLQFPRKGKQETGEEDELTWGIEMLRVYPRSQAHMLTCYPEDRNQSCLMCQYPKLTGLKGIKPGKNIELDPTLTGIRTDERPGFPGGPLEKANSEMDIGFSGHWGITSNLKLSGAINPDFSQVEADAAQLDINKQFALFYPEKRPFFLEGSDFFRTPLNTVYSRTAADPLWGVKLSGKQGKNAIGFFFTQDRLTNLIIPGAQGSDSTSIHRKSYSTVLRFRRDIGAASTLGLLITDREGRNYHNRLAGIDGLIRIGKSDTVTFQFLGSNTLYPNEISGNYQQPEDSFTGTALNVAYQKRRRSYSWKVEYNDYSPGFRADLGFMPRVDFRKLQMEGGYTHWGKQGDFFSSIEIGGGVHQSQDHNHNLLEHSASLSTVFNGPLQSYLLWEFSLRKRMFNFTPFNQTGHNLFFSITPTGSLNISSLISFGDEIDYQHTRDGQLFFLEPQINYNLGKRIKLTVSHSIDRLQVQGKRLFLAQLTQLRLIYHFNKRTFVRGILQYTNIHQDPQLYQFPVEPEFKALYTQFLFSYKLNPRTVLFLGYTDDHSGYTGIPLTQANRTFFMKIGYALTL